MRCPGKAVESKETDGPSLSLELLVNARYYFEKDRVNR